MLSRRKHKSTAPSSDGRARDCRRSIRSHPQVTGSIPVERRITFLRFLKREVAKQFSSFLLTWKKYYLILISNLWNESLCNVPWSWPWGEYFSGPWGIYYIYIYISISSVILSSCGLIFTQVGGHAMDESHHALHDFLSMIFLIIMLLSQAGERLYFKIKLNEPRYFYSS